MEAVADPAAARASRSRPTSGDQAAPGFGRFYADHLRDVTGLVYTLTGSWPAAEDIAQEAFVRAYRRWSDVGRYDRPDSWVRTVAANLATSRGRRLGAEARALMRLRARPTTPEPDPVDAQTDVFWEAVRRLPRRQAQAVALRYYSDLSVAQIATCMDCAEGTIKAHLHAARQRLADLLGSDGRDRSDRNNGSHEGTIR
jgi:RNA polymerase sigma-70 factor (ECF subfamily)